MSDTATDGAAPLIVHLVHRLDVGGMENGLVNLINHLPPGRYRHAIVCMTESSDFARRIARADVAIHALHKRPGKDPAVYLRLWHLLRRLRPDIVHTRNLATLEGMLPAALAGVPGRVHGEHGRDVHDLDNTRRRYRWLRRAYRPFVQRYVALSSELDVYLRTAVGVPAARVTRIYNGVDGACFHPPAGARAPLPPEGFAAPGMMVIGSVGRMETVKDPLNLARAFLLLLERRPHARANLRLAMVGDGPLRMEVEALLHRGGAGDLVWLPGARDDVPVLLRGLDVFVLPSLAEGISNTILEAMASARPVVATRVGGNPELLVEEETGLLVPRGDSAALAEALGRYLDDPALARRHGTAGRRRVERAFSLERMVTAYADVYDELLRGRRTRRAPMAEG